MDRSAVTAHYLSLLLAFPGLLWYTRRQYFTEDDWEFIHRALPGVNKLGLFAPHNEHWSTLPLLVYKGLFALVGVRTYLPYMAVLLALHALTAHLLWRIMRHAGADTWVSTTVTVIFLVLGSGAENIVWAFQIGFLGSLAAGTGMVLAVLRQTHARIALAWLLGVISIMCSGLGPIMVLAATLCVILREDWRRAAQTASVPAIVYTGWWLVFRTTSTTPGPRRVLLNLPDYVFTGLTSAAANIAGLRVVGAMLLLPLAAWLVSRPRPMERAVVAAMAACTPVFFLIVGLGRVALGVNESKAERYVYITAVLLLPSVAVALSAAARRHVAFLAAVVLTLSVAVYHNAHALVTAVRAVTPVRQHAEARILAASRLVHGGRPTFGGLPEGATAPDLTWADLVQLETMNDLPATKQLEPDPLDLATVAGSLEMTLSSAPLLPLDGALITPAQGGIVGPVSAGCARVSSERASTLPRVLVGFSTGSSVLLRIAAGALVTTYLYVPGSGAVASPPHPGRIGPSGFAYLDVSAPGGRVVLELPPSGGTICGLGG